MSSHKNRPYISSNKKKPGRVSIDDLVQSLSSLLNFMHSSQRVNDLNFVQKFLQKYSFRLLGTTK